MHHESYTMKEAGERLQAFELLLREHGITIKVGGDFERLALNVIDVFDKHLDPAKQQGHDDIRRWLREIVGMSHLIALVLSVRDHESFGQLLAHLRLLNEATAPQNSPSVVTDAASNKMFELVLAIAAMRAGQSVTLDDPNSSKGDNPDVLIERGDEGPFGVACKVLHSSHPQTILDNVRKAVQQIDRSPATRGVVAISLKNLFPHDVFFPMLNPVEWKAGAEPVYGCWTGPNEVLIREAQKQAFEVVKRLQGDAEYADLVAMLRSSVKVVPGLLFYVHSATGVRQNGKPIPTNFGFMWFAPVGDVTETDRTLLEALNEGAHIA
jgi:hypothetical protein